MFEAMNAVAMPMELPMNLRRSMPSFLDFSSAIWPIRYSTCFCFWFWGRGMNSSFDTSCVGMGESTPFFWSRLNFWIHMCVVETFLLLGCRQLPAVRHVIEPADHHLFPGLRSPANVFAG